MLTATFVRNEQYTVIPFPYKYIREYFQISWSLNDFITKQRGIEKWKGKEYEMEIWKHYMRLQPGPFADIKNESKQMEYRLYDKKKSRIQKIQNMKEKKILER